LILGKCRTAVGNKSVGLKHGDLYRMETSEECHEGPDPSYN